MQDLLSEIEAPKEFMFIWNLMYNKNHWGKISCYRNLYFTNTRGTITANTEKYDVYLAQKALIACQA